MRALLLPTILLAACTGGERYTGLDGGDVDAPATDVDGALIDSALDIDAAIQPDATPPDAVPDAPLVTNGQNAEMVLGQSSFTTATQNNGGVSGRSLSSPLGITIEDGYVWVTDIGNFRTLRWEPVPSTNFAYGDLVLGQTSLTVGTDPGPNASASTLRSLSNVEMSGSTLLVSNGSRILVWTSLPTANGASANRVLCQTTFTGIASGNTADKCNAPKGMWTDGVKLAVADYGNHRVLIWNTFPTATGEAADLVLGQSAFGQSSSPSSATASNMKYPTSVHFDGTRFYVVDSNQNRVMVWNGFPTSNNEPADFVLGQPDLTSSAPATTSTGLDRPYDVAVLGDDAIFVSDFVNDRVMVWEPIPTTSGVAATYVLGTDSFTAAGGAPAPTQSSLDAPMGMEILNDKLFVVDRDHHRVLRFGLTLP